MNTIKYILITLLFMSFYACQDGTKENTVIKSEASHSFEMPELKERSLEGTNDEKLIRDRYNALKQALEKEPNNYKKRLSLAEVYLVEARASDDKDYYYNAGMNILDGILEQELNKDVRFGAMLLKSSILMSLHQFEDARELAEEAVEINSYNAQIYGVLVDANVELGNYEDAVILADSMVSIRPDLRSYSRISYIREIHGDMDGAINAMELAVKAGYPGYEDTEWCRVNLGRLHEAQGNLEKAEMEFKTALLHRADYPEALASLATVYLKMGKTEKADSFVNAALNISQQAHYYETLAHIEKSKGNMTAMKDDIQKAINLVSHGGDGHDHGHSHSHDGHSHDGHSHDGDHSHDQKYAHNHGLDLARMLIDNTTEYDRALTELEAELEMRPENIDVNLQVAKAYYFKDNFLDAKRHYKKATATGSTKTELMLLGGLLAIQDGNSSEGNTMIKNAMSKNPYSTSNLVNITRK